MVIRSWLAPLRRKANNERHFTESERAGNALICRVLNRHYISCACAVKVNRYVSGVYSTLLALYSGVSAVSVPFCQQCLLYSVMLAVYCVPRHVSSVYFVSLAVSILFCSVKSFDSIRSVNSVYSILFRQQCLFYSVPSAVSVLFRSVSTVYCGDSCDR